MTEETPHPLTRMVTINKPSFWIFIALCVFLYSYNKFTMPDSVNQTSYRLNGTFIVFAAFAGLLVNLAVSAIGNGKLNRIATLTCYVFEIVCVVILGVMVFTT